MKREDTFLSLVIPVFNEEDRIEASLAQVFEYCNQFGRHEVIFVDDGSTDSTFAILSGIANRQHAKLIRFDRNRGKGAAVKAGLLTAQGELHLFSDVDFSTPIEEADRLMAAIADGHEVAIGSRGLESSNILAAQPWYREWAGKIGNLLVQALLPLEIQDTQCGFKMFTRRASQIITSLLRLNGFAFDVELLVIAQQLGLRIAEVPVSWRNVRGSKVRPVHNVQVLWDLLTIRYRLALGAYASDPSTS